MASDLRCSGVPAEGSEQGTERRNVEVQAPGPSAPEVLPVVPGSALDGPAREALELVKRELEVVEVPTDTRSYIAWERARGATDETIGVLLATGGFAPPPGFAAWTAYAVRVAADGSAGRA